MHGERVLWIVPKWPFPAEDGARRATVNLLSNLCRTGEVIDLLAIAAEDEEVCLEDARAFLGVKNVYVIRRARGATSILSKILGVIPAILSSPLTPITMRHFAARRVRRAISDLLMEGIPSGQMETLVNLPVEPTRWDAIVYDGLHPAIHAFRFGGDTGASLPRKVVYRAHNRESDIWERRANRTRNPLEQLFFASQGLLVRLIEDSLVRSSFGVATVSQEDLNAFHQDCGEFRGIVVPIGYDFTEIPPFPRDKHLQIMFLGRLDWYPNMEGLRWFLQCVWPEVVKKRHDIELVIAGSGNSEWITPYLELPRLAFLGRVDDVSELYVNSVVSIVPVFYGSGTRVKAIEACRYGRACVSTDVGVEGVGLREDSSYFRAETAEEWIRVLTSLKADEAERRGARAFEGAKQVFESKAAARRFLSLLYP